MPLSNNWRAFPHIQSVLDEAVQRKGLRYRLNSDKAAWRWRTQAYHFRKLFQKEQQKLTALDEFGATVPTIYDTMFITLEGAVVVIQFHELETPGAMTTLDGLPITELTKRYEPPPVEEFDELVEIAENLKKGKVIE